MALCDKNENDEIYPKLQSVSELSKEFNKHSVICLSKPKFTIGRSLNNCEVIACVAISRLHCTLSNDNSSWTITDTSRYGIQVNGQSVSKEEPLLLKDNDIIQLDLAGDFVYKFLNGLEKCSKKRKYSETFNNDVDHRLQEAKDKFENSQIIEIDNMKQKINIIKKKQIEFLGEKENLHKDLQLKFLSLENEYRSKILELEGKNDEVEKQKALLKEKNDADKISLQDDMNKKIALLEEKIDEQNVHESCLERENKLLLERLQNEREEFEKRLKEIVSIKEQKLEDMQNQLKQKEDDLLREKEMMELQKQQEFLKYENAKQEALEKLQEQMKNEEEQKLREIESLKLQMEMQENMTKETRKINEIKYNQQIDKLRNELETIQNKMLEESAMRIAEQTEGESSRAVALENFNQEKKALEVKLAQMEEEKQRLQTLLLQKSKQSEEEIQKVQKEQIDKEAAVRRQFEKEKQQLVSLLSKDTDSYNSTIKQMQHELTEAKCKPQSETNPICANQVSEVIDLTTYDMPSTSGYSVNNAERIEIEKHEINKIMDSELQCSICSDLFIEPTTLNCTHTFCKYCIETWKKKKKECPVCRSKIETQYRTNILESLITTMVETLGEKAKEKRQETIKEREDILKKNGTNTVTRDRQEGRERSQDSDGSSSSVSSSYDSSLETSNSSSERGDEYTSYGFLRRYYREYGGNGERFSSYNHSYDSNNSSCSDFSDQWATEWEESETEREGAGTRLPEVVGLPGSYYGGYGRCYKCLHPGHWAPGCPFL